MTDVEKLVEELVKAKKEQLQKLFSKVEEYKRTAEKMKSLEAKKEELEAEIRALYTPDLENIISEESKELINQIVKRHAVRGRVAGVTARRRSIVYEGIEYKSPAYFLKKFGIAGGIEGLKAWAKNQGKTVQITDDKIIIL